MTYLTEKIQNLEGTPRKTKMQPEFIVWLKSIDHTQRTRVIKRISAIHKFGQYGPKSHDLFDSCKGLYEIVFDTNLRIYFTVEDEFISLEDGSHAKSGGKVTGSQQRAVDRVSKRLRDSQYNNINKQWFEDFVTPTELLFSFNIEDPAFNDLSEDQNFEIATEIANVISKRTGETIEEILEDIEI